jgi:hypothetical protein
MSIGSSQFSQIQQMYADLQACDEILQKLKTEMENTQVQAEVLHIRLDRVNRVLMRTLTFIRRMSGGNDDLEYLMSKMQRVISVMNTLRIAAMMMYAGMGPIGWVMMGMGVATSVMMMQEDLDDSIRSVQA